MADVAGTPFLLLVELRLTEDQRAPFWTQWSLLQQHCASDEPQTIEPGSRGASRSLRETSRERQICGRSRSGQNIESRTAWDHSSDVWRGWILRCEERLRLPAPVETPRTLPDCRHHARRRRRRALLNFPRANETGRRCLPRAYQPGPIKSDRLEFPDDLDLGACAAPPSLQGRDRKSVV